MLRSADDWDGHHFAFRADGANSHADHIVVSVEQGPHGASATIPDGHLLLNAEFTRAGPDLILHDDGKTVVVHDYFAFDKHPTLHTPDGAALPPDMVDALTGPRAPGQYAQAGTPQAGAAKGGPQPIGHVVVAHGDATIVRNGVAVTIHAGDAVLKGDVLQTGSGTMAVTLNDGTTVNLTANSRMAVNDFLFDPNGHANHEVLDLVQGSLSFISGKIAHGGGHMEIDTPVATMGIRGTMGDLGQGSDGNWTFTIGQSSTPNDVTLSYNGVVIAHLVADGTELSLHFDQGQLVSAFSNLTQEQRDQLAAQLQFMVSTQQLGNQINQNFFNNTNPQSIEHHTDIQFELPQYGYTDYANVGDVVVDSSTVTVTNINFLSHDTTTFTYQQQLPTTFIGTYYWTGDNSNDWNTGGNWSGRAVPNVADDVVIGEDQQGNPVRNAVVSYSSPIYVNSLFMSHGAILYTPGVSVVGDLTLRGGMTEIAAFDRDLTFDIGGNFHNHGWIDADGKLTFDFRLVGGSFHNKGLIEAGKLIIDTVDGTFINAGTIEAHRGVIDADFHNDGGKLLVSGGSNGQLKLKTGVTNDNGGLIKVDDGAVLTVKGTAVNSADIKTVDSGEIDFKGHVDNSGHITASGFCSTIDFGGNVRNHHHGVIEAKDGGWIDFDGALHNSSNSLIEAKSGGEIDLNGTVHNHGTMLAVDCGSIFLSCDWVQNDGTIQAGDCSDYGGRIVIKDAYVDNRCGTIAARNGGEVDLENATIAGGTLWVDACWTCSLIAIICAVTFDGTAQAVTIDGHGTVEAFAGADLKLQGDIHNNSTIQLDANCGYGASLVIDGCVTLGGRGTVVLGGWGAGIAGSENGGTLTNFSTIAGTGTIGDGGCDLTLVNHGEIKASYCDHIVINTGWQTLDNDGGTILATRGGEIDICNAVFNHDCGVIEAKDGGQINFDGSVHNSWGSLIEAKSGGEIDFNDGVHNYGTIVAADCGSISFNCGWVENNGTIEARSNGTIDFNHWVGGSGTLAIDGGTIELGSGTCNVVDFSGSCGGQLTLDDVTAFHAQITDFSYGDTIDFSQLHDVSILGYCENDSGTGGTLTLDSCGTGVFSLTLLGNGYDAHDFLLTDTACGTLLNIPIAAPACQTTDENTPIVFDHANNNAITISDPDSDWLTVTLVAASGTLTLGETNGLAFAHGNGYHDGTMTFSGSQDAINAALDGLKYNPGDAGNTSLTIDIDSQGHHVASDTIDLTVKPEVPYVNVADNTLGVAEHGTVDLGVTAFGQDLDDHVSLTISGFGSGDTVTYDYFGHHDNLTITNGTITLDPAQVAGLDLHLAALDLHIGSEDADSLTVTATNTENGVSSDPSAPQGIHVTVDHNPPVAAADNVITNIGTNSWFKIPDLALLANDSGGASHGDLSVTDTNADFSFIPDAANHEDGYVNFFDGSFFGFGSGGSFTYQVSDGLLNDTGHVTVSQDTRGALDGTSGNDILIGKAGGTTINGNGGSDIFVGGSGNDVLNGNTGANSSDKFVFIPTDNSHSIGNDTVNSFDASHDFLDFSSSIFSNVDAVLNATQDVDGHTIIHVGATDSVTLNGNVSDDLLHQYSSHILIV